VPPIPSSPAHRKSRVTGVWETRLVVSIQDLKSSRSSLL
jgi:hypothetical protein